MHRKYLGLLSSSKRPISRLRHPSRPFRKHRCNEDIRLSWSGNASFQQTCSCVAQLNRDCILDIILCVMGGGVDTGQSCHRFAVRTCYLSRPLPAIPHYRLAYTQGFRACVMNCLSFQAQLAQLSTHYHTLGLRVAVGSHSCKPRSKPAVTIGGWSWDYVSIQGGRKEGYCTLYTVKQRRDDLGGREECYLICIPGSELAMKLHWYSGAAREFV